MKSLLLLEPDLAGVGPFKHSLQKRFPSLQLEHYEHSRDALRSFAAKRQPVVILELMTEDESDGLELVQKVVMEKLNTQIFLTSKFPALLGLAEIFKGHANIQCFKKPYKLEQLIEAVSQSLVKIPDSVITGLTPTNVLLMVHMERKNACVEFVTDRGTAYLCFTTGRLFHASYGASAGDQAVLNALASKVLEIRLFDGAFHAEANVATPLSQLLVSHRASENRQVAIAA